MPVHQSAPDAPAISSPASLQALHILVVDDDTDTRATLSGLLSYAGAIVTTVDNADAALDVLRRINPHVILSDLAMPRHSGYWLMQMVGLMRAEMPSVPGIAITAFRETETERKAFAAGFKAYLEKPLDLQRLVATIHKVIGR